jgi:hypothetical protein
MAHVFLRNMLRHNASVLQWMRQASWQNLRHSYEARSLAQAIDAFRQEGVTASFEGMEILVRRLAALHQADQYDDNALIHALEWCPPQNVIPRATLRVALKDAAQRNRLRPNQTHRRGQTSGSYVPPTSSHKHSNGRTGGEGGKAQ